MERAGIEDIKAGFNLYPDCPFYAIFETQNVNSSKAGRLIYAYKEGDRDNGWNQLQLNLMATESSSGNPRFVIQFYEQLDPKKNTIDTNTPYAGSFLFRCKKNENLPTSINGVIQPMQDQSFLNYLQQEFRYEKENNQVLQEKVEDLECEIEELNAAKTEKPIGGIIGQIGEAGNQFPWIADVIKDGFTVLKSLLRAPVPAPGNARNPGIAGIHENSPPDQLINNAIQTLVAWYIKEYGTGETEEEQRSSGFKQFANDMQQLAALTADSDIMHLALKKLRAF